MEKLTIKHLAPYLPYNVMVYGSSDLWTLTGIVAAFNHEIFVNLKNGSFRNSHASMVEHSLVLRPLSDLTKEIEHNGEKFVPIEMINKLFEFPSINPTVMNDGTLDMSHWHESQKLFEWHFDIFNLIENNLAIDINSKYLK